MIKPPPSGVAAEAPPAAAPPSGRGPSSSRSRGGSLSVAGRAGHGGPVDPAAVRVRALQQDILAADSKRAIADAPPASPRGVALRGSPQQQQQKRPDRTPPLRLASPAASPSGSAPSAALPKRPPTPSGTGSTKKKATKKSKKDKGPSPQISSTSSKASSSSALSGPLSSLAREAPLLPQPSFTELSSAAAPSPKVARSPRSPRVPPSPKAPAGGGGKSTGTGTGKKAKGSKKASGAMGPSSQPLDLGADWEAPAAESEGAVSATLAALRMPSNSAPPPPAPQPLPTTPLAAAAPPPPLPALPAAILPELPPAFSDRALHTSDLGALFWNGLHQALQPAAVDEQWSAVRRILVAG